MRGRGSPSKPTSASLVSNARRMENSRSPAQAPGESAGWETFGQGEDSTEIDEQELREFMSADLIDVGADPVFKERLRRKLWNIVRGLGADDSDDDSDLG